ncbi:galectin-4-like [Dreissena polymorpha]|uniref:Galectin n=1 Tax=Dreissena polymorpha TaxID=45954 RepID=A0A9D4H3E1_DREPO|nr:galectin-4-like [Dreissena polymorpha]KAH3828759.1 hypothetical protein DPMN_130742 [Dreissena polymorpha]
MATVATYPPTPFIYNMGSIYKGKTIFISGFIPPNADRFNVNFESKPWGPDIAFHCDFRVNQNVIVLNSFANNAWGTEERVTKDFPLKPKDFFEMTIRVEKDGFKVSVNNNCHLHYNHRMKPLSQFTHLRIDGSVIIKKVRHQ